MAGKYPLRYAATGALIVPGDVVSVPLPDGREAQGIVKHVSIRSRKVEVWLKRTIKLRHRNQYRRSVARRDVSPMPWLRRRDWPNRGL